MSSLPTVEAAAAERPLFAGFDVGGTSIKYGLVDNRGRVLGHSSIPTEEEKGPADAVARSAAAIATLLAELGIPREEVKAAGLGTPGTMDIPGGMILEPPNLPHWRNFPIRDSLARATRWPTAFANDANAAAFGEFWVGSGAKYGSMVMLTLGTGVGGGIIVDHLSIDGENSLGSECGHIIIDFHEDARLCPCGSRGHLEAYCSATAVSKRMLEALDASPDRPSSLRQRITKGAKVSSRLLAEEAAEGDPLSLELVLETGYFLAAGIVSLMHTIDPGIVALGGAMNFGGSESELGRKFLDHVRSEVKRRTFPVLAEKTVVDFASLGGDAGFIGAAGIARARFGR